MSLNYEMARYTELTGEDGTKVSVSRLGGYLDGYEKGRKKAIDEFAREIFILISLKNVNCFYDFTIEDLHNLKTDIDELAKKLKGGAENE